VRAYLQHVLVRAYVHHAETFGAAPAGEGGHHVVRLVAQLLEAAAAQLLHHVPVGDDLGVERCKGILLVDSVVL